MKTSTRFIALILFIFVFGAANIRASKVPKGDLALRVQENYQCKNNLFERIAFNLDRELRCRGYGGNLRILEGPLPQARQNESRVVVTVLRSSWQTRRAFSIPLILHRYKRVYLIDIYLELADSNNVQYREKIGLSQGLSTESQILYDNKYDPDLMPSQSERLAIEELAVKRLVQNLANKLGTKLQ